MHWFIDPIKNKYADFTGRAGRQEFWMFMLVYIGLYIAIAIVESLIGTQVLTLLFALGIFVPGIALTTRRLHDIDMSGWWQLIGIVPLVGLVVMIVLLVRDGQKEANKYGPALAGTADAASGAPEQNEGGESQEAPQEGEGEQHQ